MAQKFNGILGKTIEYPPMVLLPHIVWQNQVVWSIDLQFFLTGITKLVSWDKEVARGGGGGVALALKKD